MRNVPVAYRERRRSGNEHERNAREERTRGAHERNSDERSARQNVAARQAVSGTAFALGWERDTWNGFVGANVL